MSDDAAIREIWSEHGPERDKDHARGDDNKVQALSVLKELQSLSRCGSKMYGIPYPSLDEEEVKRDTQLSDLPHAFNEIVTFSILTGTPFLCYSITIGCTT